MKGYLLRPIGYVRSTLMCVEDAPKFYTEGAPPAVIELEPGYRPGLLRLSAGDEIIVITWLHHARRDVLRVHPRGDPTRALTGVFYTRSPGRPNPLGLHRVKVLRVNGRRVHVGPLEAIDGTPVVDLKPVVEVANDY
jgi:tRNA-Thr(GGU) m(6)t(6)A37 methyltransferase TsaA